MTVEEFLQAVPDPVRRADAQALAGLLGEITGEPAVMWGSAIVAFGRYRERLSSGRETDAALAAFSPRKPHLVLYGMSEAMERDAERMQRLGPRSTGKGCLYIKRLDAVDRAVLRELVAESVDARRERVA
jgi:hypothetical protein